jgi:hypothetical protein
MLLGVLLSSLRVCHQHTDVQQGREHFKWSHFEEDTSARFPTAVQAISSPAPTSPPTPRATLKPFKQGSGWASFHYTPPPLAKNGSPADVNRLWDKIQAPPSTRSPTLRPTLRPTLVPTLLSTTEGTKGAKEAYLALLAPGAVPTPFNELSSGGLSYSEKIALSKGVSPAQRAAKALAAAKSVALAEHKVREVQAYAIKAAQWKGKERAKGELLRKMGESDQQIKETLAVEEQRHQAQQTPKAKELNEDAGQKAQKGDQSTKTKALRGVLQRMRKQSPLAVSVQQNEQESRLEVLRIAQARVAAATAEVRVAELDEMEHQLLERERYHKNGARRL